MGPEDAGDVEQRTLDLGYDALLDALDVAVVVYDREGHVRFANRRAGDVLASLGIAGRDANSLLDHIDFVDERGTPLTVAALPTAHTVRTGETLSGIVLGMRAPDGPLMWVTVGTSPTTGPGGEITGVVCTFVDVTARRDVEQRLRTSEERFRLIAEKAADVVYRIRVGGSPRFEFVNPAVEAVLGYTPKELYDDAALVVAITHEEDVPLVREIGVAGVPGARAVQLRMRRRDGVLVWTEHHIVPLRDAAGTVIAVAGIARDVTESKAKEAFLSHRALHDPLTELPNRVLLLDRLEGALARMRRHPSTLAVLYVDLDHFKLVNDELGHEAGDRVLQVVGSRLQETLRPSDSIARLGGDEFAAVLPDLGDAEEATVVAGRLLDSVALPFHPGMGELRITASIGVATTRDDDPSATELLRRADTAMYAAKERGRARVECYEPVADPDAADAG